MEEYENHLRQQTPLTAEEQMMQSARSLTKGQEPFEERYKEYYEGAVRQFNANRRREMFEKVALATMTWETPWSWQDCAKQTESLLKEADKFAKGE